MEYKLYPPNFSNFIYKDLKIYNCWSVSLTERHTLNTVSSTSGEEGQAKPVLSGGESHTARQGKGIALLGQACPKRRSEPYCKAGQRHCSAGQACPERPPLPLMRGPTTGLEQDILSGCLPEAVDLIAFTTELMKTKWKLVWKNSGRSNCLEN